MRTCPLLIYDLQSRAECYLVIVAAACSLYNLAKEIYSMHFKTSHNGEDVKYSTPCIFDLI
jgi:hypothetical protein